MWKLLFKRIPRLLAKGVGGGVCQKIQKTTYSAVNGFIFYAITTFIIFVEPDFPSGNPATNIIVSPLFINLFFKQFSIISFINSLSSYVTFVSKYLSMRRYRLLRHGAKFLQRTEMVSNMETEIILFLWTKISRTVGL